jgi:MFS family permease
MAEVAEGLQAAAPTRRRFLAAALAIGCLQTIAYGTLYYPFAVLKQPMADSGVDSRLLLGAVSGAFLLGGLLAPHVGRTVDRWDGRRVMASGTLSGGIACALIGFAQNTPLLLIAVFFLGLAFAATLYDAAFSTVVRIVQQDGRTAITLITLVAGFASTIFWPLTHALESELGWQATWQIYALLNIAVAAPAYLLLPRPMQSSLTSHIKAGRTPPGDGSRGSRRVFILLAFAFACNALVAATLSIQVIDLIKDAGLQPATAVSAASLIGAAQVAGRLAEFLLRRNVPIPATGVFAFACLPLALVLLFLTDSYIMAAAFASLYGVSNGLVTIVKGALPLSLFGPDGYGGLMGRLAAPQLIAESLAPFVSAIALVSLGGRASVAILLMLACLSLLAMVMLVTSRPKRPAK